MICILLPCRNEAENLPDCLHALEGLAYPTDRIRYLLADDHSSDETGAILANWAAKGTNRQVIPLGRRPAPGENGKALALAEMAAQVRKGEFMLFTDADCRVPPGWAACMAKTYRKEFGLVTGITRISGNSWFARMQALDWWLTLGKVKVVADWGYNLTAMGNNMAMAESAYRKAGGFLPLTGAVTEDLALARAVQGIGYRPIQLVNKAVLVSTLPELGFTNLMKQRKRWMRGAFLLPWYWQLLLGLQVGFYLALMVAMYYVPLQAGIGWCIKILVQSLFIGTFAAKTETKTRFLDLICFEIYNWIVSWSTVLYYFWPGAIQWKNRNYR
ncbi:glycosyltransferase [Cyclobacterium xiamenense]|jgi:cellulose synthase/poly-beta-1,6-N-acetylglucosamine synthase-like glycosyltransferase|uniref:glycosyltransferase n=1 Tax=Cyclobacterium xiamenense TaxID=1297121 RepID=UPI0035CF5759